MTTSLNTIAHDVAAHATDAARLAAERTQELAQQAADRGRHGLEQIGLVSPRRTTTRWWVPALLIFAVLGVAAVVIGRRRNGESDARTAQPGSFAAEHPLSAVS